jgi:predicted kinase
MNTFISIGPPLCGKTSWWDIYKSMKEYNEKDQISLSPKEIYFETFGNIYKYEEKNNLVSKILLWQQKNYMSLKYSVIYIDDYNESREKRTEIIKNCKTYNYNVFGIYFDISIDEIRKRNSLMEQKYDNETIEIIYNTIQQNIPSIDEGFDDIILIKE